MQAAAYTRHRERLTMSSTCVTGLPWLAAPFFAWHGVGTGGWVVWLMREVRHQLT
jgi:hypothetical protein